MCFEVLGLGKPSKRFILITFCPFISKEYRQREHGEKVTGTHPNLAKQTLFDRFLLTLKFKVKHTCSKLKCGVLETLSKTIEELESLINIVKKWRGKRKDKVRNTATNTPSVR